MMRYSPVLEVGTLRPLLTIDPLPNQFTLPLLRVLPADAGGVDRRGYPRRGTGTHQALLRWLSM